MIRFGAEATASLQLSTLRLAVALFSAVSAFAPASHADRSKESRGGVAPPGPYRAPLISIRHEEDEIGCKLISVPYPAVELSGWLEESAAILNRILAPHADVDGKQVRLAKINLIYDMDGRFIRALESPTAADEEPLGLVVMLNPEAHASHPEDESAEARAKRMIEKEMIVVQSFRFNDPKDIMDRPRNLVLGREADFSILLDDRLKDFGLKKGTSLTEIAKNSGARGALDMATLAGVAAEDFSGFLPTDDPEIPHEERLALVVMEGRAYNHKDLGNYLWGAAMHRLGVSYPTAKIGSEVNGLLNTRSQNRQGFGIILMGDSDKDQEAIRRGYFGTLGKGSGALPPAKELNVKSIYRPNPMGLPGFTILEYE